MSQTDQSERLKTPELAQLHREFWGNGHCPHSDCPVCEYPKDDPRSAAAQAR